ncbi:MAG: hypothetical protein Q8Q91_02595 [Candidatus Daviesbacteria bacterium]|nr:hypothetical protein [Candidatus Daviesbacteria bacterium]
MNPLEGKWPVLGTGVATIAAFSAALLIMFRADPFSASVAEKLLFFFSIFMGIWGLAALIIFSIRRLWSKHSPSLQVFNISLWQGFLASILLISLLIYKVRPF